MGLNTTTLIDGYIAYCKVEKGLDSKTLKAYQIDLRQFDNFIQSTDGCLSKENLQAYLAAMHKKFKIKSVKRKIASLKAFFNYLAYEEILEVNPFTRMRIKLHEPFILPKVISLASIDAILRFAYGQMKASNSTSYGYCSKLRDVAVLELLFATGVRVSELCSIRKEVFDLRTGVLKVYGKGAKERLLQVSNPAVLSACSAYYSANAVAIEKTGWFFVNRLGHQLSDQSVRNMVSCYARQAGIEQHITPHMFRHTFATLLLEEEVDIRYIQQLLGHSSITTTQIYTHVSSKKQRDILSSKHPRNKITV